jgi:hypothetical protein
MTLRCREILRLRAFSRLAPMFRSRQSLLLLALGAAAALGLTACGEEDAKLLPGQTAREITANLDTVQQLSDEGDCLGAESAAAQVGEQIEALEGVDAKLKQALEGGANRLEEVIAGCDEEVESLIPTNEEEAPSPAEEKEAEQREKEEAQAEKEAEKEEKAQQKEEEETEGGPSLPPQANGEAKGHEKEPGPPSGDEEDEGGGGEPSGGVSPGSPAGEGD